MTRSVLTAALALAIVASGRALAQVPQPTPAPDPHTYTDPAMSFTAPPDAVLLNRQELALNQLGEDLTPVAAWVLHPGKEDARTLEAVTRGHGAVFLVDPKSHRVLWSAYRPAKGSSSDDLNRTASDIVSRLQHDLKTK